MAGKETDRKHMKSKTDDASAQTYTMGYSEAFLQLLERRSAQSCAAYLLPHLRPGQQLLDFGCGPGTISVGLAEAVRPGVLHGIDMEPSQIGMAADAATAGGHDNMELHTGDVTELPFEDNAFDAAHGHAVLMHVPDTSAALAEVRRVLRPGGLIACREAICASSFFEPASDRLNEGWDIYGQLLESNGGHAQMGRQLKRALQAAGFGDIQAGAEFEFFDSTEDIGFFHGFTTGWFCSPETVDAAVGRGLTGRDRFERLRRSLDGWKEAPGAVAAIGWGYALGRKR